MRTYIRHLAIAAILFAAIVGCMAKWPIPDAPLLQQSKDNISESAKLAQLSEDFWQNTLKNSPTWATYLGDRRFDADLSDITPEAFSRQVVTHETFLQRLHQIDINQLTLQERMTLDVLKHELTSHIEKTQCKTWMWSVDQLDGPQVFFAELSNFHTIKSVADAQNLIARYKKMTGFYGQQIANLKQGEALGYTSPKINITKVIKQLDWQLAQKPQESPYFQVVNKLPGTFTKAEQDTVQKEILAAIENEVYQGLSNYRDFLKHELLKRARNDVGISSIPNGQRCYQALIKQHTGLSKSPDEIHQLGINEVARIKVKMAQLGTPIGSLQKKSRAHYLSSREEMLGHNQRLVTRAQSALPRAFGRIPVTPIEVKSIEPFREQEAPAAYYYQAPSDQSRPAFYYLNTYQPKKRPLYDMAVLAFHEGLPGHHLQIALANENKNIPEFQRQLGQTAFIEGWALYAEGLANELGLYEGPDEKLGAINYELWRALRLVVDTGIHHKGWSRPKAIRYLAKQTALPKIEVANEIDRYIIWPAQALAYKIGQLEITALREKAEKTLGSRFSLTAFHDRLLGFGALPLPSMRNNIETWIQEQEGTQSNRGLVVMP